MGRRLLMRAPMPTNRRNDSHRPKRKTIRRRDAPVAVQDVVAVEQRTRAPAASPDKKWTVVIRDSNIFLRDDSGTETQLSQDGKTDFAYTGLWSPDSAQLSRSAWSRAITKKFIAFNRRRRHGRSHRRRRRPCGSANRGLCTPRRQARQLRAECVRCGEQKAIQAAG